MGNVTPKGESQPPGSGICIVEILVPTETDGAATPTGNVEVAIETTVNDSPTILGSKTIAITK